MLVLTSKLRYRLLMCLEEGGGGDVPTAAAPSWQLCMFCILQELTKLEASVKLLSSCVTHSPVLNLPCPAC